MDHEDLVYEARQPEQQERSVLHEQAERCNQVAYERVDRIQPHGFFFGLHPDTLRVSHVSANVVQLLARDPRSCIDTRLTDWIEESEVPRLKNLLGHGHDWNRVPQVFGQLVWNASLGMNPTSFLAFRSADLLCLECDDSNNGFRAADLVAREHRISADLTRTPLNIDDLSMTIAEGIRDLSQFDRAYVLRFDDGDHGFVCGESNNGILPSLLHHHFPSSDIPKIVRSLYLESRFRMIPRVDYEPIPILGSHAADSPLDLTYSVLRETAKSHSVYLRNMGVNATASFSVVISGKLWGLVGVHSKDAQSMAFEQLAMCQNVVELFSRHIAWAREEKQRRHQERTLASVSNALSISSSYLIGGDPGHLSADELQGTMLNLVDADGFAVYSLQAPIMFQEQLGEFAGTVLAHVIRTQLESQHSFVTTSLGRYDPSLSEVASKISGVLVLPFDDCLMVWVRREQIRNQVWAGNPDGHRAENDEGMLGPRTSFESWQQLVRGTSQPWRRGELRAATMFRDALLVQQKRLLADQARRQSEEANRAKTIFLANMSHELRTPIHAIINFARQGLEDLRRSAHGDLEEHYTDIRRSGDRLLLLVNDLLELGRLQSGKVELDLEPHSITTVIEESWKELRSKAQEKQIQLTRTFDVDEPLMVDRKRMVQVVVNLLSNAIKFADERTSIEVAVRRTIRDERRGVLVSIEDEGPGINPQDLEKIFGKFYQSSRTQRSEGTGLGLAISREIVSAHGGTIWAENRSKRGAKLCFEIPCREHGTPEAKEN